MRSVRRISLCVGALTALVLALAGCGEDEGDAGDSPATRIVNVDAQDVTFRPKNVTVAPGTTVRWTNRDGEILHTVTKVTGPGEESDSGNIYPGMTYERRFDVPGRADYVCTLHDGQVGSVTVR